VGYTIGFREYAQEKEPKIITNDDDDDDDNNNNNIKMRNIPNHAMQ
jgi:hypothetical protein